MPRVSDAKQRLMEAAINLIWENSYGSTSVDAICAKAKVKKGSFYYFFASKSDLAVAAMEDNWQTKQADLDRVFSPTIPPLERLTNYFNRVLECQEALQKEKGYVLGCPLFTLGCEVCTQDQAIRGKVEEILNRYLKYLETTIRDAHEQRLIVAPNAAFKAKLLFAYAQGVLTQARILNSLDGVREMSSGAMELLGVTQTAAAA
ncbi:MAG: TetR/AcrR family transcriptional regulator [Verrucomicrobiota bacterium]